MGDILYVPNNGSLNFSTISDFKECMRWGGEVEFIWKGIHYGVIRYGTNRKIPNLPSQLSRNGKGM